MNYQKELSLAILICLISSVSARGYTCHECCTPSSFSETLPEYVDIPCAIVAILALIIWYKCFEGVYLQNKRVAFDKSFQYSGTIPFAGEFDYKMKSLYQTEWIQSDNCKIKFIDSVIVEIEGGSKFAGIPTRITDSSKMLIKVNEYESLIFYLTQVPGSEKPGFVAVDSLTYCQIFVLLPDECQTEIPVLFPLVKSNFLKLCFILIVLMIALSTITFCLTRDSLFYSSYYLSYALGYPWGAFVSCFGIFIFIIFTNPFGCCRSVNWGLRHAVAITFFYNALAVICLTFSILDYTYAGFIDDNNLVDTRSSYTLEDHQQEFESRCQFNQYDCSVTYSANLTDQTDSCQDAYILQCFSFDTENNSCSQERNNFYLLFVFQGLFEFFLAMFWYFVGSEWINCADSSRWLDISRTLEEMNGRKEVKKEDIHIN